MSYWNLFKVAVTPRNMFNSDDTYQVNTEHFTSFDYLYQEVFRERDKFMVKYSIENRDGWLNSGRTIAYFTDKQKAEDLAEYINARVLLYQLGEV